MIRTITIDWMQAKKIKHGFFWYVWLEGEKNPLYLFDASIRRELRDGQTVTVHLRRKPGYFSDIIEKIEEVKNERTGNENRDTRAGAGTDQPGGV